MLVPNRKEVYHKSIMLKALSAILDHPLLSKALFFKGGSCAALLGWIDRFSVDLDFDLKRGVEKETIRKPLKESLKEVGLKVKQEGKKELFYIFSYSPPFKGLRSKLKISIVSNPPRANRYKAFYLPQLQRYCLCQTPDTAFANKLVAVKERWEKYKSLAGRDLYDIRAFFLNGFKINKAVIEERRGIEAKKYLLELAEFIEKKFTQKAIDEDLNPLLEREQFLQVRKVLKQEVVMFLRELVDSWKVGKLES